MKLIVFFLLSFITLTDFASSIPLNKIETLLNLDDIERLKDALDYLANNKQIDQKFINKLKDLLVKGVEERINSFGPIYDYVKEIIENDYNKLTQIINEISKNLLSIENSIVSTSKHLIFELEKEVTNQLDNLFTSVSEIVKKIS